MSPKHQTYDFSNQLLASKDFFDRSTRVLEEADSGFRPQPGMMTVAQQVAHVAHTLDWFVAGVSRPEGFDLDFEKIGKEIDAVTSLGVARVWLDKAFANTIAFIRARTADELAKPLPAGPVMGGQPTSDIVWAMVEHTAHHRGALTVYSRMMGKVPPMPYGG
ncbi:MAG TPA: DinB family protein [Bryobacteraceae bacterium]|nr:DinB family protein [Bryobacteraceae bacterium]